MKDKSLSTLTKLLNAAKYEFAKNGFYKTSVETITKRAGVGKGTFYLYFKTKEDVIRYMVNEMSDTVIKILKISINTIENGVDDFETFLKSLLKDTISQYLTIKDVMLTVINSNYELSEELTSFKSKNIKKIKKYVEKILLICEEKGYIRKIDIKVTADILFMLMLNFFQILVNKKGKKFFDYYINSILNFILYGIYKRE